MIKFDLEQEILDFSGIVNDIRSIVENSDDLNKEEVKVLLTALCKVYDFKFDVLFSTFENSVRDKEL